MKYNKKQLLSIAQKIVKDKPLSPDDISYILNFEKQPQKSRITLFLKKIAVPASLAFGAFFTMFPQQFEQFTKQLPPWTNVSPTLLIGVDYLWDLIGEPVRKSNILYHIPNIILYSFGIFGIKKIIDTIEKKNWLDKVYAAQKLLQITITAGKTHYALNKGHTILFVGRGDYIGMQFVLNHPKSEAITVSETKPHYSNIWNYYNSDTLYEDLKGVIKRSGGENAGEYVFFPVKDDQIFLPGPTAYDVSPHKLDIICQNIRTIEKENKWKPKRIIIVGDRSHRSYVQSEDEKGKVRKSEDIISLESISKKYPHVTLLDPTDIVLSKIIEIANGREIVFRATKEGIKEYKNRFYNRLKELRYKPKRNKKGILTIGYDIFEDQTEQQMLSRKVDDYFPVVLSKNVHDALIRNGYKKSEFFYVPDIILAITSKTAAQQ